MPNGKLLGKLMGDEYPLEDAWAARKAAAHGDGPGGRFLGNDYEYTRDEKISGLVFVQSVPWCHQAITLVILMILTENNIPSRFLAQ